MAGESPSRAFFYGTLMHPKILTRVIGNDGAHLQFCPAVLLDYTRHKHKNADYPGIVPTSRSQALFDRPLTREERSVRGTLVEGLTPEEIETLDYFEGNEYTRERVLIHLLGSLAPISSLLTDADLIPTHTPALPSEAEIDTGVPADTYVFCDINFLDTTLWNFEEFVKLNAWKWYGKAADNNDDIEAVERRRSTGGRM